MRTPGLGQSSAPEASRPELAGVSRRTSVAREFTAHQRSLQARRAGPYLRLAAGLADLVRSARPAASRKYGPAPSSLKSGSDRWCAVKSRATEVRLLTPHDQALPARSTGPVRRPHSMPRRSPFRVSMSRMAASRSPMRRPGRDWCWRNFRSTAISALSSDRSTAKAPSSPAASCSAFGYRGTASARMANEAPARRRSDNAAADRRDRRLAQLRSRRAAIRRHAFAGPPGGHVGGRRAGHEQPLATCRQRSARRRLPRL